MNPIIKISAFGTISGLLWSAAPGLILGTYRMHCLDALTASILAGIFTSFACALALCITHANRLGTILTGAFSLPLGAFIYGGISHMTSTIIHSSLTHQSPVSVGLDYAVMSMLTPYTALLMPLAILTTFALKLSLPYPTRKNAA